METVSLEVVGALEVTTVSRRIIVTSGRCRACNLVEVHQSYPAKKMLHKESYDQDNQAYEILDFLIHKLSLNDSIFKLNEQFHLAPKWNVSEIQNFSYTRLQCN